jgi:hypothetical protein
MHKMGNLLTRALRVDGGIEDKIKEFKNAS